VPALYATSAAEIEVRRRAFIRKWRLKCKAVADSLEEAGDRLFTFTRLPVSQWKSARTTNAGTPFTGTLGFRTLYWNDGGIFAISSNKLIINPTGHGISGLGRTTRNVTIIATQ
jgi:hypothetical protein